MSLVSIMKRSGCPVGNALIGTSEKRTSSNMSEVDGLWIALSDGPATLAVTVAECVDNALVEILQPLPNGAALPIRDANRVFGYLSCPSRTDHSG